MDDIFQYIIIIREERGKGSYDYREKNSKYLGHSSKP